MLKRFELWGHTTDEIIPTIVDYRQFLSNSNLIRRSINARTVE